MALPDMQVDWRNMDMVSRKINFTSNRRHEPELHVVVCDVVG